jgi:hypothetical protein
MYPGLLPCLWQAPMGLPGAPLSEEKIVMLFA